MTWPVAAEHASEWLLAVPLGSTEQHGPHLPLATDTTIAEALAHRLAAERSDVVVAPALAYGSSGEHASFPGTLSIGAEVLCALLVELVRSADAFGGVVFVNAHGGNAAPMQDAAAVLRREGRRVLAWAPQAGVIDACGRPGDAHAGRTETSLLLELDPDAVRTEQAEAGDTRPLAEIFGELRTHGIGGVSPNGVLGDPTGASALEGHCLFAALATDLAEAVARW